MVKAIWAVACSAAVAGILMASGPGCASAPTKADVSQTAPGIAPEAGQGSAPATPTQAEPLVVHSGPEYRIGTEDLLYVSVWDNKELTLDVVVRPDGKISMPLVQDVQAEGLTTSELASLIDKRLRAFIKIPQVFVAVKSINSPKAYILGNVVRQGPISLRGDISVLQALSLAGGFTQFASPKKIKIVRSNDGTQEIRTVNYYDIINDGAGNYLLKPGDTIVVP